MKRIIKAVLLSFALFIFAISCSSSDDIVVARPTLPTGNDSFFVSEDIKSSDSSDSDLESSILDEDIKVTRISNYDFLIEYPSEISIEEIKDFSEKFFSSYPSSKLNQSRLVVLNDTTSLLSMTDSISDKDAIALAEDIKSLIPVLLPNYVASNSFDSGEPSENSDAVDNDEEVNETYISLNENNINSDENDIDSNDNNIESINNYTNSVNNQENDTVAEEKVNYLDVLGYPIVIEQVSENVASIEYPKLISDNDLFAGLIAIKDNYENFIEDSGVLVVNPGSALLIAPVDFTDEDLEYINPILQGFLDNYVPEYIASLLETGEEEVKNNVDDNVVELEEPETEESQEIEGSLR